MAINTCTITDKIFEADGSIPPFARLRFELVGWDSDQNETGTPVVAPVIEFATVDDLTGEFSITLWQNGAGLRGTHYTVILERYTGINYTDRAISDVKLGKIQIDAGTTSADLTTLLSEAVSTSFVWYSAITQAEYDAAIAAKAGAEAAETGAVEAKEAAEAVSVTGSHFASGGPVVAATTANITLSGEQTIDGVTTSTSRVLVKDQAAPEENGIYVTASGAWARASDMDAAGEVQATAVYVSDGTTQGGMSFATYSAVTTLGTDAIDFVQVASNSGVQSQIDGLQAQISDELGSFITQRIGPTTVTTQLDVAGSTFSLMNTAGASSGGIVRTIDVFTTSAGMATIFTATDNGDGTVTIDQSCTRYLISGANVDVRVDLPISKDQLVGMHGLNVRVSNSGDAAYYASGLIGTNTAVTEDPDYGLQFSADILATNAEAVQNLSDYGDRQRIGRESPANTGSNAVGSLAIFEYVAAAFDGYLTEVEVAVNADTHQAQILVVSMNGDGTVNLEQSYSVDLFAGLNRVITPNIPVAANQYVGIIASGGVKAAVSGAPVFYTTGIPTTNTSKAVITSYGLEFGATITAGTRGQLSKLNNLFNMGDELTGDGSKDETTALTTHRSVSDVLMVPPGEYAITDVPISGDGLWGPGELKLSGEPFFIHRAPSFSSLFRQFRSAVARQIGDTSGLALLGDSITQGTIIGTGTDWSASWGVKLSKFANAFTAPGDLPAVCQFNSGGDNLELTLPVSPTIGTNGPVGESLVLQDGESITFTGDFDIVDVFYTQESGAGSLAFAFNGAAAYRTINCADAATVYDATTYDGTKTDQTGTSGTYTITASGGAVEITGLLRLDQQTDSFDPRLPVFNFGRNSQKVTMLTSARITSMVKQSQVFGGDNVGAIMMFGENDQIDTVPDTIYSNIISKVSDLQAAGVKTIWGCGILRPTPTTYTYSAGCSYAGANGAVRAAYQDAGVPILPLDSIDFEQLGYLPVHPNEVGQVRLAQMIIESIARSYG